MDALVAPTPVAAEAARRRTFAIIAHPDAGKTTLTERLLLRGGAIQLAGAVRAKGNARRTRSDWMKIEQDRGISVATSVMTFERGGLGGGEAVRRGHGQGVHGVRGSGVRVGVAGEVSLM